MTAAATPAHTVAEALALAQRSGLARLDAQMLLLHALGRDTHDRAWLLAHADAPLPPTVAQRHQHLCAQRLDQVPTAYLTGHKAFHGVHLQVDARVLDPRPDTETLVDWALDCLRGLVNPVALDLGTGSGAIALALKKARPDADVHALDASPAALAVARQNGERLGLAVHWSLGDWLDGHAGGPYDLIASNPPYLAEDDPHLQALRHEPRSALVAGTDGLDDIRRIARQAGAHLKPGGWLLLEHGWTQASAVQDTLRQVGFGQVQSRTDLAGIARCTGGQRMA